MQPTHAATAQALDQQIAAWLAHLRRSPAIGRFDLAELEDHLREQMASLVADGLSQDEAFLVALKRMGAVDAVTREFAQEHSERLWKQLVLPDASAGPDGALHARGMWVAVALAVAAAIAIKVPALFGVVFDPDRSYFYPLNIGFLTLPFVVAYFAWERALPRASLVPLAAALAVAALVANALPFPSSAAEGPPSDTQELTMLHLPLALWFAVGFAYVGGRWRANPRRMDFIRFTGEFFIYFVLIALGGGVLVALTLALFQAIGIDAGPLVQSWILPCGVAGTTVIAAWLVEAKKSVIENMAPVLARIFVPLFTLVLLAFVMTMLATGRGMDVSRGILIAVDLLLVVVFGLLLYSISARDPASPPGYFDAIQLTLVGVALLVDGLALWAIAARITEFGFTPNRLAALGMNVVLLVNLAISAVLYARFLRRRTPLSRLLDWQMGYLYAIAGWAAVVAFLFPFLFRFA